MKRLRNRIPHVLALALCMASMDYLRGFQLIEESGTSHLAVFLDAFMDWSVSVAVIVATIAVLEATTLRGWRRVVVQSGLLALGVVATSWLLVGSSARLRAFGIEDGLPVVLYKSWLDLAAAVLMSWFYGARERSERATRSLFDARIARRRVEHEVIDAQMKTQQARFDPRRLLEALDDVQRAYVQDLARGEAALDELIERLHAATLKMGGTR